MGVTLFVFEIQALKRKIKSIYKWLFCCHGNLLRHINMCILFSNYWCFMCYHNITTMLIFLITDPLQIFETGFSHLKKQYHHDNERVSNSIRSFEVPGSKNLD